MEMDGKDRSVRKMPCGFNFVPSTFTVLVNEELIDVLGPNVLNFGV
jgi:hypothetical protein